MLEKFRSVYLVCVDMGDDINHVLARNSSLKKARKIAEIAEKKYDSPIYITMEKITTSNLIKEDSDYSKSISRCICGSNQGGCVGNLNCKCNALAKCKNVTRDPYRSLVNQSFSPKKELSSATIKVIDVRRGIVEVVIPEWNEDESFGLSSEEIPAEIRSMLEPGLMLSGDVNLDAGSVEELIIENLREFLDDDKDEDLDDDKEEELEDEEKENIETEEESLDSDDESLDSDDESFKETETLNEDSPDGW